MEAKGEDFIRAINEGSDDLKAGKVSDSDKLLLTKQNGKCVHEKCAVSCDL